MGVLAGVTLLTETGKLVMSTAADDTRGKHCWDCTKLLVCSP